MANMEVGPKMLGTVGGGVAAINYAPDATLVTLAKMGYPVDPAKLQQAVESLVNGGWIATLGFAGLMVGLVGGYFIRRAQARWGNDRAAETPVGIPEAAPPA